MLRVCMYEHHNGLLKKWSLGLRGHMVTCCRSVLSWMEFVFMWEGEELEWGHWRPFFFWRWMECVGPAVDTVSLFRIIGCLC